MRLGNALSETGERADGIPYGCRTKGMIRTDRFWTRAIRSSCRPESSPSPRTSIQDKVLGSHIAISGATIMIAANESISRKKGERAPWRFCRSDDR